ncbi:MAG: Gfo/Idh/MocA family oxidoreductase [Sphingomonadales bacterium]|nr:Gfo/Idh/MocA family oxidoreductase [Sphingomonadales bacterium]MDE2169910.1 Gfo/Idh/MocA family oxidoreductase [Sphingomonadales bacterium]
MTTPVPLGLVGYGKIARDQHLPAIAALGDFELTAIADPFAVHPDVASHGTIETMLATHPEVAAISLCQPPRFRMEAARAALRAGRHVMLEKPPALSMADLAELVDLAREKGVTLYTAWHSREAAAVDAAREWLAQTTIRRVSIVWKEDVRRWHPGQTWIWQAGGFGVFDPAINALSILTSIVPGPIRVDKAVLDVPTNCETPIAGQVAMTDGRGAPISMELDFLQTGPQSWDITVETDAGLLTLGHGGNMMSVDGVARQLSPEREYQRLYARFAELIAAGQSEVDGEPLRLALEAIEGGQIIPAPEFHE